MKTAVAQPEKFPRPQPLVLTTTAANATIQLLAGDFRRFFYPQEPCLRDRTMRSKMFVIRPYQWVEFVINGN